MFKTLENCALLRGIEGIIKKYPVIQKHLA